MVNALRDWTLDRLRVSHHTNLARLLIMQGNLRCVFQTELFQGLIQDLDLLDRQVSVHLDYYSPYSNPCRHRQFGHIWALSISFPILGSSGNGSISSDCYFDPLVQFDLESGPGGIRTHDLRLRRPPSWSWLDYRPRAPQPNHLLITS